MRIFLLTKLAHVQGLTGMIIVSALNLSCARRCCVTIALMAIAVNCSSSSEKHRERAADCGIVLNLVGSSVRPTNPSMADSLLNLSLACGAITQ